MAESFTIDFEGIDPSTLRIDFSGLAKEPTIAERIGQTVKRGAKEFLGKGFETATGGSPIGRQVGETLAELVPTTPADVGQMAGTAAVGLIPGIGPGLAATLAALGGGAGRVVGSQFESEPGSMIGEAAQGALTNLIPPTAKKAFTSFVRTPLARAMESVRLNKVLKTLNDMLPAKVSELSRDTGVLQRQLSKGTVESIIDEGRRAYNNDINTIIRSIGQVELKLPSLGRQPVTVEKFIRHIEETGAKRINAEKLNQTMKGVLIDRQKLLDEFNAALTAKGGQPYVMAYTIARNNLNRVMEAVRLLTGGPESKRPLNLTTGKLELSKLQRQFLTRRERGELTRAYSPKELERLEAAMAMGEMIKGIDQPSSFRTVPGRVFGSLGGYTGGVSAIPVLPHAAGVEYTAPSLFTQTVVPPMATQLFNEALKLPEPKEPR